MCISDIHLLLLLKRLGMEDGTGKNLGLLQLDWYGLCSSVIDEVESTIGSVD